MCQEYYKLQNKSYGSIFALVKELRVNTLLLVHSGKQRLAPLQPRVLLINLELYWTSA